MKHTLCTLLLICVASVALISLDAQATRSKPPVRTVVLIGPSQPLPSCPSDFSQGMQDIESFPELTFSEQDVDYADGYQYSVTGHFSCFAPASGQASTDRTSVDHWLANTRLIPSFPQTGNLFFLPAGWHWIEFDR
ncbi:hypothetical protein BOTU111921_10005 [Bordetella tumbae]|uniref:hypothetical protein n=1 Tax=Bordetella tumbae TaxID=1649139 RepID=UPI0039EFDF29